MTRIEKKLLDDAFRKRAAIIGVLNACNCTFPIKQYPTRTAHADGCRANVILRSMMIADARALGRPELAERIEALAGNHCSLNCECRFIEQLAGPHCPLDCACRFVDAALKQTNPEVRDAAT